MRCANLILAVVACGLTACHTVPLFGSPVSSSPAAPPPLQVYSVEWWKQLVRPEPFEYAPREAASPAFDKETRRVILLTRDGIVRALSAEGKEVWTFTTRGRFEAPATVSEGVAYVPGEDGFLYALDVRTGKPVWTYDAKEDLGTAPVLVDGKVLVASLTDTLYVVDQKTGKWLWQYRRDAPSGFSIHGASRPLVSQGIVYVGFADGHLVALTLADGAVKWDKALSGEGQFVDVDTSPVMDDAGHLYAASYKDGVYALDPATGDILWHTAVAGITQLTLAGGTLYAAGDQQLQALSITGGQTLWAVTLKGKSARQPVLARNFLIVPVQDALVFVDPITGKERLAWDPGEGVSAPPLWTGSRLYVLSNMGYVYEMRLTGRGG